MISSKELNAYAEIIDDCRKLVDHTHVSNEISFKYSLFQLYGKSLLTMCEIYTLLQNGYPEGAMALSRNLYESLVIMTHLYNSQSDQELMERFIDDYSVKTCQDDIKYLKWCIDKGMNSDDVSAKLNSRIEEFSGLQDKYKDYIIENCHGSFFKQYWWAGKNISFSQLRKLAGYEDNAFYDISCYRVHAGITGSIIKFDNQEDGILIGSCENGKETPMVFSLMNFQTQSYLFFGLTFTV